MSTVDETRGPNTGLQLELNYQVLYNSGLTDTSEHFDRCGYLPLDGLVPETTLRLLRSEIGGLMPQANRKDFVMKCMGGTPRHMTTLGGQIITEHAPAIAALYNDTRLREGLGALIGRRLVPADDPVERHVLNILHRAGDTHGFHVDDYPVALVMFVESPTCPDGCGRLEFCPAVEDLSTVGASPHQSMTKAHRAGDAYLLRSDKLQHRVQPIHDGCVRTVLNFAYGFEGEVVAHTPSASLLYS